MRSLCRSLHRLPLGYRVHRVSAFRALVLGMAMGAVACGPVVSTPEVGEAYDPGAQRVSLNDAEESESGSSETGSGGEAPYRDGQGLGWRIEGGVFRSAVTALRVQDGGGWHFVRGADEALAPAEFALRHGPTGAVLTVLGGETFLDPEGQAALTEQMVAQLGLAQEATVDLAFGGSEEASEATISLRVYQSEGSQVALGALFLSAAEPASEGAASEGAATEAQKAQAYVVQLIFPNDRLTQTVEALQTLQRLQPIVGEALARLRQDWSARPEALSRHAVLREGQMRDFEVGVRMRLPEGIWQAQLSGGAVLRAVEQRRRVVMVLGRTRAEGMGEEDAHQRLRQQLFEGVVAENGSDASALPPPTRATLGGQPAWVSEGIVGTGVAQERRRGVSLLRGEDVLWWTVSAPVGSFASSASWIESVEASLVFDAPSPTVEVSARGVQDRRLAFAFAVPRGFRVEPPIEAPTHSAFVVRHAESTAQDPGEEIALLVFPDDEAGLHHVMRLRERTERDLGPPESEEGQASAPTSNGFQVDGRARWSGARFFLHGRLGGLRVVMVNLAGDAGAVLQDSLRLLPAE